MTFKTQIYIYPTTEGIQQSIVRFILQIPAQFDKPSLGDTSSRGSQVAGISRSGKGQFRHRNTAVGRSN